MFELRIGEQELLGEGRPWQNMLRHVRFHNDMSQHLDFRGIEYRW